MPIALNLMACRQNPASQTVVMWGGAEAGASHLVLLVARRRLAPEEVDAALAAGLPDVDRVRVPATAGAVQDDLTPGAEPRYYGVVAALADGSFKPLRFRAGAMSELPDGTLQYSSLGGKALEAAPAASPPPAPAATGPVRGPFAASAEPAPAPAPVSTGAIRGPFARSADDAPPAPAPASTGPTRGPFARSADDAPAPAPAPVSTGPTRGPFARSAEEAPAPAPAAPAVDPMEARRQAQLRAQQAAAAASGDAPPAVDPMEARRRAQQQAAAAASGGDVVAPSRSRAAAVVQVAPPSEFPIARFGLRMSGATQSWDGLRILWESEGKPAEAYEVVVADHPLDPDEVGDLLSGRDVGGARVRAFARSVKTVIDNVTPRDARGYSGVIARAEDGSRELIGSVAQSVDECNVREAPFFDAANLGDVRDLANGAVREAKMQLLIFSEEQDVGAWREALRLVGDALAIYPGFEPATTLEREIRAARQV